MKTKENQVTVYSGAGMFGVSKKEGTLIEHGTKKYAQYDNAAYVHFIPSGKRKLSGVLGDYKPFILILAGVGHPEPQDAFVNVPSSVSGVTVKQSKYASCDERWITDFDEMIDRYIENEKPVIVTDYRYTKGFNSSSKFVSDMINSGGKIK